MRKLSLAVLVALLPLHAFAGDTLHYGWMPGITQLTVNDPDGSTKSKAVFDPWNFVLAQSLSKDSRLFYTTYFQTASIKPGVSVIGQDIRRYGVSASYESQFRFTRDIKPWGGAGLVIEEDRFKNRYTVDHDGYLLQKYKDRSVSSYGVTLSGQNEWSVTRDVSVGARLQYVMPLGRGVKTLSVSVVVLY